MRIIGANMPDTGGAFLHAGYMSASPRAYDLDNKANHPFSIAHDNSASAIAETQFVDPFFMVDTEDAFALASNNQPGLTVGTQSALYAGSMLRGADIISGMIIVMVFTVAMSIIYAISGAGSPAKKAKSLTLFTIPLLLPLICIHAWLVVPLWYQYEAGPILAACPWEGVELQEYARPELATRALLNGVILDALLAKPIPVQTLAQLKDEIALPKKDLTPGEQYALKTYGLDGWGRPFRFVLEGGHAAYKRYWRFTMGYLGSNEFGESLYKVTSAGKDGVFDTDDDIAMRTQIPFEYNWEYMQRPLYAGMRDDKPIVFYHRWSGAYYRPRLAKTSWELTGRVNYDIMVADRGFPVPETPSALKNIADDLKRKYQETNRWHVILYVFREPGSTQYYEG